MKSWLLSGDPIAWSTQGNVLAHCRLVRSREKPLAGYMYIGLGKPGTVRPAIRETNVDTRKTTCYRDAKEKAMM